MICYNSIYGVVWYDVIVFRIFSFFTVILLMWKLRFRDEEFFVFRDFVNFWLFFRV